MIQKKDSRSILEIVRKKIKSKRFLKFSRKNDCSFKRNRKMPFIQLVYFMLNSIKKTLQLELTEYMLCFTKHKNITKSSYCQQRMKLKPEAFIELNDTLVDEFYTNNVFKTWNEFRLLSIDGSTLQLPRSNSTIEEFGVNNEQNMIPMARISTMYDLLNEIVLSSSIGSHKSHEFDLAIHHFQKLKENDLLILDRLYGARWLFYMLIAKKVHFVIRIQHGFGKDVDDFWNSSETSKIITVLDLPKKSKKRIAEITPFKFRLVKVFLENGETEVLATSLLDEEKYPIEIFKELYNKRWGIETNYNHLKNHIELANFSGYSSNVIKQDFYANMFISNIQTLIVQDAQSKLNKEDKKTKYKYKINKNLSLGYMKNRVVRILMGDNPDYYEELVSLFLNQPIPIRPERNYPRKEQKYKRKNFMNQRRCL